MNYLKITARLIAGTVFIFSGIVKGIDPLGFVYKLQDYFTAFNLEFLREAALLFVIIVCTAEFIAGISVLFNLRIREGIIIVAAMMAFFTPLTLILAISNPVSDCGCFGDAIKMTNWQTFFKNIVILIPSAYLFIKRKEFKRYIGKQTELVILTILIAIFIGFMLLNLKYLPVIDFLPYSKGSNIPEKMIIPEGSSPDRYETTFIYEKDGIQKEFTLENYPADDTTWHFFDQKTILVEKGYQPPIHDLSILNIRTGIDLTENILANPGYTMLMVSTKLAEAKTGYLDKGYELGDNCSSLGIDFYVLTSSGADEIPVVMFDFDFCQTDEITLKTMVRSNPGFILIKGGTIIDKWSWATMPGIDELKELIDND